jgi:hypothetical protein
MPRHDPVPHRRRPDPGRTERAWAHFKASMRWTALAAVLAICLSLLYLWSTGPVGLHMLLATALGVGLSVLVAGALMGLIFLSDRSGHDEDAAQGDIYDDDDWRR